MALRVPGKGAVSGSAPRASGSGREPGDSLLHRRPLPRVCGESIPRANSGRCLRRRGCNFYASRLPSAQPSAVRTDPHGRLTWLDSFFSPSRGSRRPQYQRLTCPITAIQTLSITVRNGEGPSLGRQARPVKLSMRKEFVLSRSSLGSGKRGEQSGDSQPRLGQTRSWPPGPPACCFNDMETSGKLSAAGGD